MKTIRIGTRGSALALAQTAQVEAALRESWPDVRTETVILHTRGDRILDKPLSEIGEKGLFVSEFESALMEGRIDLAVHSAKAVSYTHLDVYKRQPGNGANRHPAGGAGIRFPDERALLRHPKASGARRAEAEGFGGKPG